MKILKTLPVIGLMVLATSCGVTKTNTDTTTSQTTTSKTNRGRANTEISANTNTAKNIRQSNIENPGRVENEADTKAANEAKMERMFTTLEMSDSQISDFKTEWSTTLNTWKTSNRNKEMNNFERIENQDRILKNILDEKQFEKYRVWARENAGSIRN